MMPRIPNRFGGGARTNANGLHFEQTTSLDTALTTAGYCVIGNKVFDGDNQIGLSVQKHDFYKYFLEPRYIRFSDYNSKKWLPDECFVNLETKIVYIIEKKFQKCTGSVDEKLPNCDFKKRSTKNYAILSALRWNIFMYSMIGLDKAFIETLSNILKM